MMSRKVESKSNKDNFQEDLAPEQHSIGLPAGAEILAKSAQAHAERTGFAVIKVDGTSAFNRQRRRRAFAAIHECRPELVRFAAQFYDGRSTNVTWEEDDNPTIIKADDGWDQGDPFAPIGFSYGLRTPIRLAHDAIAQMVLEVTGDAGQAAAVRVWTYLDDLFLLPRDLAGRALDILFDHVQPTGYETNASKLEA